MKKKFSQPVIAGALIMSLVGGSFTFTHMNVSAATPTSSLSNASKSLNHAKRITIQFSDSLLALLKLDRLTLQSKLDSGLSLADVAKQQNVTRDALKAEITKQANQIIENKKKDFETNLENVIDSKDLGRKAQHQASKDKSGGKHGDLSEGIDLTTLATILGYANQANLKSALDSGSSLADLANTKKVNIQIVKDELTKQVLAKLDKKFKAGIITSEKLKIEMSNVPSHVDHLVNKKSPVKGKK